jgi:putative PIN family toxin of toxin-antitoxin system
VRAVIDTNVVVSGLIRPRGNPGTILRALRDRRFSPIVSPPMLAELAATLARPWLQSKYGVTDDDARDFLRLLALRAELVEPTSTIRRCRDPRDDIFLEAAVDGGADRIVTGDDDLLAIGSIEDVQIVAPADFVAELD